MNIYHSTAEREEEEMAMAWVWTVMAAAAVIFGALTGRMAQVGAAALEGGLTPDAVLTDVAAAVGALNLLL